MSVSVPDVRRDFEAARLRLARSSVEGGESLVVALHEATELATEVLGVERCGIWLFVEQRRAIRCYDLFERSSGRHSEGTVLRAREFPAYFEALETTRVVHAHDALHDQTTRELDAVYLAPLGIGSMLDAPLFRNGEIVGVVCNEHVGPPRGWSTEEIDFASALADSVSLKMEAAALRDAENALAAREARLEELRKWEALGLLASGVAHDFRNVLTAIMAHASVIVRDRRSPERADDAKVIMQLAEQGAELAKDLMTFGSDAHAPGVLDVAEAVRSSAAMLRSLLRGGRCEIAIHAPGSPSRVFMDRTDLRRLLFNLVSNARDAMEDGGCVEVRVEEAIVEGGDDGPVEYVVVSVRDHGDGIRGDLLPRIFDPYFTTKAEGKGTGLGLAIVRSIVERAGGFVRVDSAEGEGATVSVYVPRITVDAGRTSARRGRSAHA